MLSPRLTAIAATALWLGTPSSEIPAEDWPTHLHDVKRSGVSGDSLALPLREAWTHRAAHPPRPAWPPPAKQDFWHHHRKLQPEVTYDRAFHVAVAGGSLYYGSSADDAVRCLDARSGALRWKFLADGPVRLAPTVAEGRVLFGSDDGSVYCLEAPTGRVLWKRRLAPERRLIPGNGRMISSWPVRTGVLVDGEVAYAGAGLFPTEGIYLYALHPKDGSVAWVRQSTELAPQGYLFASGEHLFVPTGRGAPARVLREDGSPRGDIDAGGGAFALVSDDVVVSGPGRAAGSVDISDSTTRERLASFPGLRLIVHAGRAYLQSEEGLSALDRVRYVTLARERLALEKEKKPLEKLHETARRAGDSEQAAALAARLGEIKATVGEKSRAMAACFLWKRSSRAPYSLILAGGTLVAGGEGRVVAFRAADGEESWASAVEGRAYGLAVADGRLFVSTDTGAIHCFEPGNGEP